MGDRPDERRSGLRARRKNGSRRGNEADGCARWPGNPPRYSKPQLRKEILTQSRSAAQPQPKQPQMNTDPTEGHKGNEELMNTRWGSEKLRRVGFCAHTKKRRENE